MIILYSYWRSTTSYRVRAALNLKGVVYETRAIDLLAGAQSQPDYLALNPSAGVPALQLADGSVLTQSLAIIEYLDAAHPQPPLLPDEPILRSRILAAALSVATDIHPVNNLRVIAQLKSRFDATPEDATAWMQHWIGEGFTALEALLPEREGFSFTDTPSLADLCIVSQLYNAHRWGVDLGRYPKLRRIEAACLAVPEIAAAAPEAQPDAPNT